MSSDVEWETFCNFTECPSPEGNVTGLNETTTTIDDDYDSAREYETP